MLSIPEGIILFGGYNFKNKRTEDTIGVISSSFSKKKKFGEDVMYNIFNDLWVFEFKNMSWYKPIIGGKHPRKSFNYCLEIIPLQENFKCVFISSSMKKNKIYEMYSSGKKLI